MHIPDGYLGPTTCGFFYVVMVPIWMTASRMVKKTLKAGQIPFLAIGAAFSFVIMMFNVPIPAGSTGHAVGGALIAILLGPWGACLTVSVALVIQAFLFGDGGLTAIGANCFNMAVVLPFSAYLIYRLLSGSAQKSPTRNVWAAGIAGYLSINIAALCAGVEFGLQPLLYHTADGQALYCPFGLSVAVPAMLGGHLLVFGWIEGLVTALLVKYLQQHSPEMLARPALKTSTKLWACLGILAVLTPLGLLIPAWLHGGDAWGEWAPEEIQKIAGYVPQGLQKLSALWNAPLADYGFKSWEGKGLGYSSLAYIISAVLGAALIAFCVWLLFKYLFRKGFSKK